MAMAQPNPGLGKRKVTRHYDPFRRVTSAPPDIVRLRSMLRPLAAEEVNAIWKSAKEAWSTELRRNGESVTTYNGLHAEKYLDEPTQNRLRPSSKGRSNKPHPPSVFLVTRLKKVDGCYSPQEAAYKKYEGSAQQNLDKYISAHKHDIRRAMEESTQQRPHTSMDAEQNKMPRLMSQTAAQASEAWIKLSNDQDKAAIREAFKKTEARIKKGLEDTKLPTNQQYLNLRRNHPNLRSKIPQPTQDVYSSTRWMKRAGAQESNAVQDMIESIQKAPPRLAPTEGPHFHITDYAPMFSTAPRQPSYDFQIHPEWQTPWHKKYEVVKQ